jgi:hypothetical protein
MAMGVRVAVMVVVVVVVVRNHARRYIITF